MKHVLRRSLGALVITAALSAPAAAQVFGTFPWQMQPYCNVVTLSLTNTPGGGWVLDGTDDQCGATNKASAVGVASFSSSGNVTLNFTIVTAPGGKPVHVSAIVSPATGGGTWNDSVGNSGAFAFFGSTPGLPVRPLPASGIAPGAITTTEIAAGAIGVTNINTGQVQARVSGSCAAGQTISAINVDGTVTCDAALPAETRFKAGSLTGQSAAANAGTRVSGWGTLTNVGGGTYDATTGVYTVPAAGVYLVTATVTLAQTTETANNRCIIVYLSNFPDSGTCANPVNSLTSLVATTVASLASGATIDIRVQNNTAAVTSTADAQVAQFSILRLR